MKITTKITHNLIQDKRHTMMNKDLIAILDYLDREKGIKRTIVLQAIEDALYAAAKKSVKGVQDVRIEIDYESGDIAVYGKKLIVQKAKKQEQEISLEEALEAHPDSELGELIEVTITPKDFGRIAAQTARQVISQKLRGAERDVIYDEYRHRVNEIVSGSIKQFIRGSDILVDLGKVEALMPMREYPKTERYNVGDKVTALLKEVKDTDNGGAEVILSRSSPDFVKQLFIQEVPEISDSVITIHSIVREAGYRTKITVQSTDPRIDPVGACVGMRGSRVKNVVRELNNEKIDIIPYADDPIELLQNALSPVEIKKISINEQDRIVTIVVDDDDFPTVIGKKGMNARLNGRLIDAEITVKRMTEYRKVLAIQKIELAESEDPSLDQPLELREVNNMIVENLIEAGFDTKRKILQATSEQITEVPGVSEAMLDLIHAEIRQKGEEID
ncbi:MAG: Transcription termination/antitermination protein NusA [Chlamydiae bacterium]|nr:Transcription termination/antitermination protein NusA [Chlamydiota bacterium]